MLPATAALFRCGAAARNCEKYFVEALRLFYSVDELTQLFRHQGFVDITGRSCWADDRLSRARSRSAESGEGRRAAQAGEEFAMRRDDPSPASRVPALNRARLPVDLSA